ncbi:hypothetical protein [Rheinheimera sp.]|uniref:hypothetical protein n=1 Tax=Rheinheimera sp. TaxID=1869214 RepID=UPI0025E54601|nr:hypothetical protein [Rheinheimera sp.]
MMKSVFGCVLLMLAACSPQEAAKTTTTRQVQLKTFTLSYLPGDMPVETPLLLKLDTGKEAVSKVTGIIRGKTMYMGEIPLRFERKQQQWQAELMLGACTEPRMQWQLELEVTYQNGDKITLQDSFYSRWPD